MKISARNPAAQPTRDCSRAGASAPALERLDGTLAFAPLTEALLDRAAANARDPLAGEFAMLSEYRRRVMHENLAFAVLRGECPIAAGGVAPVWPRRGEAWALIDAGARPREIAWMTRRFARFFAALLEHDVYRRIDVYVVSASPWRESFAAALGLALVAGPMPAWDPIGRAYHHYAILKGEDSECQG